MIIQVSSIAMGLAVMAMFCVKLFLMSWQIIVYNFKIAADYEKSLLTRRLKNLEIEKKRKEDFEEKDKIIRQEKLVRIAQRIKLNSTLD